VAEVHSADLRLAKWIRTVRKGFVQLYLADSVQRLTAAVRPLSVTVLVPTGALLAVFTNKMLDAAVFGAGMMVVVAFWLADSVGYFYQRRLRVAMTTIWQRRAERCAGGYDHVPTTRPVGPLRAALNASMLYYLILASLLGIGFLLLRLDVIGSIPVGVE
jgi:hypothetical protein